MFDKDQIILFGAWAQIASTVAVVLGILLATVTYFYESNRERRTYTFEMAERYFSGELLSAREALHREYLHAREAIPNEFRNHENSGSLIRARYASGAIDTIGFERSVFNVLEFFNVALSCIEQDLCRRAEFLELTQREAEEFRCVFRHSIDEIKQKYSLPDIDRGLLGLSEGARCQGQ